MNRAQFARKAFLVAGGVLIWSPSQAHDGPHQWITPHSRNVGVEVIHVDADVAIKSQVATTTLMLTFKNPARSAQEGQAIVPVPEGAALKSFAMEGSNVALQAKLLPHKEARTIYDEIVSQLKDPALLEFAGMGAVRTSVFPIAAGSELKLRLVYEELLTAEGDRVDYHLPRTQSISYVVPWKIKVKWKDSGGIRTVYSPSHEIEWKRKSEKAISFTLEGRINPGPLSVSILKKRANDAVASILAHSDKKDEGYFLMLLSPPERAPDAPKLKREVTLVMDRSGSMAGEKIKQARAAAKQVIGGLEDGERFNLITYNEAVEQFAAAPVELNAQTRDQAHQYITRLRVSGGTNIHDALTTAVAQPVKEGFLPMVLFLTDGLPTIGETSEKKIRETIAKGNAGKRRIFTFGVGVDVNTPLLSRLADDSRAVATYVLPSEDVEVKMAQVFRRLSGPVLSSPKLEFQGAPGRVTGVLPSVLPDFFTQDQVVILGRYHGADPLKFILRGSDGMETKAYEFHFKPKSKSSASYIPRLWATRRIALLTEALRDLGADSSLTQLTGSAPDHNDPRVKELVDEIVRLSTEHGILTEYTAFLARDGEILNTRGVWNSTAANNFVGRALKSRSGAASANQDVNLWAQKSSGTLNRYNDFVAQDLSKKSVTGVQQFPGKTFYQCQGCWVDHSAAVARKSNIPATVITIGSPEFFALVDRLVTLNQQSALALGKNTDITIDGKIYQLR